MTIDGMTTSLRIVIGGETEIVIATVATIAFVVMTATMAATATIAPAAFSAVSLAGLESATNINRSHLKMPRRTSRHFILRHAAGDMWRKLITCVVVNFRY